MAKILPFKGILPQKNRADKIVTLSADNYSYDQAKQIILNNPLSYLSVIYPDIIDNVKTSPHSIERFNKIYNRFQWLQSNNYFLQDNRPAYYIYKQQHPAFEFDGIIGAISTEDYWNGNIKIHEQTLSEREKKLKEYLKYVKINAEPVLFFYPDNAELKNILSVFFATPADIEVEINGIKHYVWKSFDTEVNARIQKYFYEIGDVFIADGHHRSSSSSLLARELKNTIAAQYFLGAFFPESALKVYSFHRLLNNITIPENFIEQLSVNFEVKEINSFNYDLKDKTIGMYWNHQRFLLFYKNSSEDIIDTEILYHSILKDIFKLKDIRNNSSVEYYPAYTYSIKDIEKMVDERKYQIAFFTHPVSVKSIKTIALQNKIMPPKSTYVLPKLLNALVIYSLENSI